MKQILVWVSKNVKRKRPLVRGYRRLVNHISHVENDTESSSLRTTLMYRTYSSEFRPWYWVSIENRLILCRQGAEVFVQSQRYPNSRGVGEFKKLTESSNYSVKGALFNPSLQYLPLLCVNLKKVDIDLT